MEITIAQHDTPMIERAMLQAFGRSLGDPLPIIEGRVTVEVPSVRSPVVMSLCSEQDEKHVMAELIAFPKRGAAWPADEVRVYQLDVPNWFNQWQRVVGVDAVTVDAETFGAARGPAPSRGELLIVDGAAAGESPSDLIDLAQDRGINVLALGPNWGGKSHSVDVEVTPDDMYGPLSAMRRQHKQRAIAFRFIQPPHPAVMNRRIWIDSADGPLVEQLGGPDQAYAAVVSYLPWLQALGRTDFADKVMLTILRTAAELKPGHSLLGRVVIHPASIKVTARQRPILAAALRATEQLETRGTVHVLDLRGGIEPGAALLKSLELSESGLSGDTYLLILGDSAALNGWRWLRLDRDKMKIRSQSNISWLPDDALPASAGARYRLMHTLTGMGVPLSPEVERTEP
ncbi:MAG: hypothetical protein ACE5GE_17370 [Phycisphaerae bacterium]